MNSLSRRSFLAHSAAAAALAASASHAAGDDARRVPKMSYGLVTYLWAQSWDLPTLIDNCQKSRVLGVELRTTHAHGVEPTLNAGQRGEVRRRFADSEVELVGLGSNERFDSPNADEVRKAIETTREFLKLSHDVGGSGVKVKPDRFHPNVPREQTIAQIGKSLNELGRFAADYGQEVRLEVHGQCAELPTIKSIMDIADHRQVVVCWNSNPQDLQGQGLAHNFSLVKHRFGRTLHVHDLYDPAYPYDQLIKLLWQADYAGWVMLEAGGAPEDPIAALVHQRKRFEELLALARG